MKVLLRNYIGSVIPERGGDRFRVDADEVLGVRRSVCQYLYFGTSTASKLTT